MSFPAIAQFMFALLCVWVLCVICYRHGKRKGIQQGRLDEQAYVGRQNRQARRINRRNAK